jgi:hypothetical protein
VDNQFWNSLSQPISFAFLLFSLPEYSDFNEEKYYKNKLAARHVYSRTVPAAS